MLLCSLAATALTSCKDDDGDGGKFNPDAKIWINARNTTNKYIHENADGTQRRQTAEEICKGDSIALCGETKFTGGGYCINYTLKPTIEGSYLIDTVNMRLPLTAGNADDGYTPLDKNMFLDENMSWVVRKIVYERAYDLLKGDYDSYKWSDTLAYVPMSARHAAKEAMRELWDDRDGNREEIYRIFNEAFYFIPCTGEEYKALLEKGEDW